MGQDDVNALLVAHGTARAPRRAAQGRRPVRLRPRRGGGARARRAPACRSSSCPACRRSPRCPSRPGIPVTHRGISQAVTAFAANDVEQLDARALAQVPGTLVAFMGGAVVERLAERLIEHGKPASTPAAVVSRGTLEDEQVVVAPLGAIGSGGRAISPTPALVVIGEVVAAPRSARRFATICRVTQFRRVDALPPYAFAEVERLKLELRRAGEDVIDLGFGNPDVPPPEIAVEKLPRGGAAPAQPPLLVEPRPPESPGGGLRALSRPLRDRARPGHRGDARLGAKEGLVHLLWVLLGPGDVALVPSPSYPIHLFAPGFAGAAVQRVPVGPDADFLAGVHEAWEASQPRPRVLLCSFPHNPTTAIADRRTDAAARRLRARARAGARPRLRVRGPRIRRLHAAFGLRG